MGSAAAGIAGNSHTERQLPEHTIGEWDPSKAAAAANSVAGMAPACSSERALHDQALMCTACICTVLHGRQYLKSSRTFREIVIRLSMAAVLNLAISRQRNLNLPSAARPEPSAHNWIHVAILVAEDMHEVWRCKKLPIKMLGGRPNQVLQTKCTDSCSAQQITCS
jgi:hypothetical protein